MATFRVGQVVRIRDGGIRPLLVGMTGRIVAPHNHKDWVVRFDQQDPYPSVTRNHPLGQGSFYNWMLEPLIDPSADEYATKMVNKIKGWKPEPVLPLPGKVKA